MSGTFVLVFHYDRLPEWRLPKKEYTAGLLLWLASIRLGWSTRFDFTKQNFNEAKKKAEVIASALWNSFLA